MLTLHIHTYAIYRLYKKALDNARKGCTSIVIAHRLSTIQNIDCIGVESGSDDPDYLGHFFGGSGGSHPQTNLSGCDPDF